MKTFLILSLGAIVGTNARYFLTRFANKEFGPAFPYGTLFINIVGSLIVGFFVIWTTEKVSGRSALAPAGRSRFLRIVHDLLRLRL